MREHVWSPSASISSPHYARQHWKPAQRYMYVAMDMKCAVAMEIHAACFSTAHDVWCLPQELGKHLQVVVATLVPYAQQSNPEGKQVLRGHVTSSLPTHTHNHLPHSHTTHTLPGSPTPPPPPPHLSLSHPHPPPITTGPLPSRGPFQETPPTSKRAP